MLPGDLAVVRDWNGRAKAPNQRIRDDLLPDPILGDALKASLIVLALNPSWEGTDAEDHARPEINGRMRSALAEPEPFFWLQGGLEETAGGRWWRAHLRPLIDMTSSEAVRGHVAVGQLHQYHSKASTPGLSPPSGRHNLEVVRKGIAKGTPVIALAGGAVAQGRSSLQDGRDPRAEQLPGDGALAEELPQGLRPRRWCDRRRGSMSDRGGARGSTRRSRTTSRTRAGGKDARLWENLSPRGS